MILKNSLYTAYTDGGSRGNPGKSASAFVIYDQDKVEVIKEAVYLGISTNNSAEYQALRLCLEKCAEVGISKIKILSDSELMVKQIKGLYQVKDTNLLKLFLEVKKLIAKFQSFEISHIKRAENKVADLLVNQKLDE